MTLAAANLPPTVSPTRHTDLGKAQNWGSLYVFMGSVITTPPQQR